MVGLVTSQERYVARVALQFARLQKTFADAALMCAEATHALMGATRHHDWQPLRDVAGLAGAVVAAVRLGVDPGDASVLERYQRWRRFDTVAMGIATDGLNRLFSNRSDVLRAVRDVGLGLVDRMPGLKRLFIREAAGLVGETPKLLRGELL